MKILTDTKVAGSIGATTVGTGIADWLQWIPDDIGKLATVVGILLSLVLILTHCLRAAMEFQRHRADMEEKRNGSVLTFEKPDADRPSHSKS